MSLWLAIGLSIWTCLQVDGQTLVTTTTESTISVIRGGMPTIQQRNSAYPNDGRSFCGPAAAANGLLWLADRGYPSIQPSGDGKNGVPHALIADLAEFMGTGREGTTASSFRSGIKSYLRSIGYSRMSWEDSGKTFAGPPDLRLIESFRAENTVVWLGLGWYRLDECGGKYTRTSGHWVALAGYETEREGAKDLKSLILADPVSPDGYRYTVVQRLAGGRISNGRSWADATGYHHILESRSKAESVENRYCILETIEVLTMN